MPAYSNNPGTDEYSDAPASAPAEAEPKKESQGEEKTAIIPKTLLAGKEFKPGEEVVFKIVRFHDDDQVEIAYATGEEKEHAEEKPEASANPAGDAEMAGNMY